MPIDHPVRTTVQLLQRMGVHVTSRTVKETLEQHPDYPSLLSISESLSGWKVNNACIQVEPDNLEKIPIPFITHLRYEGGIFVTVISIEGDRITYLDGEKGNTPLVKSRKDFIRAWTGAVLVAEAAEGAGEENYKAGRQKELLTRYRAPALLLCCTLLAAAYAISSFRPGEVSAIAFYGVLSLKYLGSLVTGLLLYHEIDESDPIFQQLCTYSKKDGCKSILDSRAAKLFGLISWSEIGFSYFAGGFFFTLLTAVAPGPALSFLALLNLATLPYILFSLYYQWRIARQWCPLCLAVQALLAGEFLLCYLTFRQYAFLPDARLLVAFGLPLAGWKFIRPLLLQAHAAGTYKVNLVRLKRNVQIFQALLERQKPIAANTEGLGIVIGNPRAVNTIVKVCNPYCGPCSKAHHELEELLRVNDNLKIRIIFTATEGDKGSRAMTTRHLLALYAKSDPRLMQDALAEWYHPAKKDYEAFAAKYPMNGELKLQDDQLSAMNHWCKETGISFTPTIFVNGYQLPEIYTVADLKYFLPA